MIKRYFEFGGLSGGGSPQLTDKERREIGRKPFAIVCTTAYEFEGIVFNVGDISDHSFGRNIPKNWRKATQQDIDNYINRKPPLSSYNQ